MRPFDAYDDDMAALAGVTDEDVDRLLAGKPGADQEGLQELAAIVRALKATSSAPDDATRLVHLAEITQAARLMGETQPPAVRQNDSASARPRALADSEARLATSAKAFAVKTIAAVVGLMGATTGLAYAGVDLPGQVAERVFAILGLHLPNQASSEASEDAVDGDEFRDAWSRGTDGNCVFGSTAVDVIAPKQAAKRGSRTPRCGEDQHQERQRAGQPGDEEERRVKATGTRQPGSDSASSAGDDDVWGDPTGASSQWRNLAEDVSGGASEAGPPRSATGEERSSYGRKTASRASGGKSGNGSSAGDKGSDKNPTDYGP